MENIKNPNNNSLHFSTIVIHIFRDVETNVLKKLSDLSNFEELGLGFRSLGFQAPHHHTLQLAYMIQSRL